MVDLTVKDESVDLVECHNLAVRVTISGGLDRLAVNAVG